MHQAIFSFSKNLKDEWEFLKGNSRTVIILISMEIELRFARFWVAFAFIWCFPIEFI